MPDITFAFQEWLPEETLDSEASPAEIELFVTGPIPKLPDIRRATPRAKPMRKTRAKTRATQPIPPALRVFAWNLAGPLTPFGRKQIALNVIERGRAWHWTKLPKGWFDLDFCLAHGQKKTQQTLRELFPEQS